MIHSIIPTPSIKHVPIIPHVPEQKHHIKNPSIYSVSSMMTENIKLHKPYSYTKSHLKNKDALPSYQEFSYRISTESILTLKVMRNRHKNFWKVWEQHKEDDSGKKVFFSSERQKPSHPL